MILSEMCKLGLFCAFLSVLTLTCLGESVLVNTPLGPVQGTERVTADGVKYYQFDGIPYAEPPEGSRRFQPPEPMKPWTEVLIADKSVFCLQNDIHGQVEGTEDCLHVYVSVPKSVLESKKPVPVMVNIHGGAFLFGSGNELFVGRTDFFMDKDVIIVSLNYRLGPLGFLSTEDKVAPGNYGLMDQAEALKWVQQNIASFGGNPNEVTIFGCSAGGASVLYQVLSPLTKGLFQRAIPQSGSPINPWSRTRIAAKKAKELGTRLGCPTDTSENLLECLRNKDGKDILVHSLPEGKNRWGLSPFVWVPRVDSESKTPMLPREPIDMMASGDFNHVPLMLGITREEGLWLYPTFPTATEEDIQKMSTDWQRVCEIGVLNSIEHNSLQKEAVPLCNKIRKFYVDDEHINNVYHQQYIDLLGAAFFASGVHKAAQLMKHFVPVYFYSLDFFSQKTNLMRAVNHKDVPLLGVQHADDLMYLFNHSLPELAELPEKHVVEMMTTLWANFAKTGIPTFKDDALEWPKNEYPDYKYLSINLPPSVEQNYRQNEMKFWEEIFSTNWYKQTVKEKQEL